MEKNIRNTDIVTWKLKLASIRATNHRLGVVKEEKKKREEMMEKQKIEAMATKRQRASKRISLSNEKKKN